MPLPLIIIGAAALAGATGVGAGSKAVVDKIDSNAINEETKKALEESINYIDEQRTLCRDSLINFAEQKINTLDISMRKFVDTFEKIKNVNFKDCEDLDELSKCHFDNAEFEELKADVNIAGPMVGGLAAGASTGALVAFGSYGAVHAFACASTGTAISALHGVAASNATLAFLGGGTLANSGMGIAGGTMVLGGLVIGPALLAMGIVAGIAVKQDIENTHINQENVKQVIAELSIAGLRCQQIRRRVYIYENLLSSLDARFLPLVFKMEDIVNEEGFDYRAYKDESKKIIASAASTAVSIKAVLDKTILDNDGNLTEYEM